MCFSLAWIEQILIWLVVVVAIVAILRILVPFILAQLGVEGGIIMQIINIAIWAIVLIFIIYFAFAVIGCLLGSPGMHRLSP